MRKIGIQPGVCSRWAVVASPAPSRQPRVGQADAEEDVDAEPVEQRGKSSPGRRPRRCEIAWSASSDSRATLSVPLAIARTPGASQ